MKIKTKFPIILIVSALITACHHSMYYDVENKGVDRFQITVARVKHDRTLSHYQDLAKYEDAQVTLDNGFKYFVISEEKYLGPDDSLTLYKNKISCYVQKPNNDRLVDASEYLSSHSKPVD